MWLGALGRCGICFAAVVAVAAACGKTESDDQRPQPGPDSGTTTTPDAGTMADAAGADAAPPTPTSCLPGDRSSCGEVEPGIKRYLGLSRQAYENTIASLLGVSAALPELWASGNAWISDPNTFYGMELYTAAAAVVAPLAVGERERLMGCAEPDDACLAVFVESFAPRAFRAPVSAEEQAALVLTYQMAAGEADDKFQALMQAILASPRFYTRSEMGAPDASERFAPLTSYELASKLSYLFWEDMPDDALLADAASGELTRTAVLSEHARRMLQDPRAWQGMAAFYREWLHLDWLDTQKKDELLFPEWSPELAADMKAETVRFLNEVWFGEDPSTRALFAADFSFVSPDLAELYGVEQPEQGLQRITLPSERRGLLTHASLLSVGAHERVTSALRRGLLVRDQLLCTKIAPPPPFVPEIDLIDPLMPAQERMAESDQGACAGCHVYMNPIGYAFEHFDAVGRYRETLGGAAIDATGRFVEYEGEPRSTFDGAIELSSLLAEDPRVFGCVANEWLERASGKSLPSCSVLDATAATCASGNLRELIVRLVTTEVFRFVSLGETVATTSTDEECEHRGSTDCQALVAAGAELDLETCEACQGAPCDSRPDCGRFLCADGVYVVRGCCDDEDCRSVGSLCAIAGGPNWLCAPDYF